MLLLLVKDTGSGIPTDKQGKIFERFYQADNEHLGSGIGLSLVQRLVELHHGHIEVESAEGIGTTFTVCLPTDEAAYSPEEKAAMQNDEVQHQIYTTNTQEMYIANAENENRENSEDAETKALENKRDEKILIVEDNPEIGQYLSEELGKYYQVLKAENGEEAMALIKDQEIDLILTDVMMPVMDEMKAVTGESTNEFIRKMRFSKACKLLKEGRYTVSEISVMVGYNTPSYFATSFKKYFDCLPSEYGKKRFNWLAPNDTIQAVIVETADNLCERFDDQIGCIRSWDFGHWNYPVIIDNMMNLDLLFNASRLTGDKKYYNVAVKHAKTTMQHHFRPDYTCYHVISYNNDGTVESKGTHQGQSDTSDWARGQAWAVYGYTACYRETQDIDFLKQAIQVANMIMKQVKTNDSIPYWDYDAPDSAETPRDASAASVMASALLELSTLAPDGQKYFKYAERIMENLSGAAYLAEKGKNQGYVLMHSVGSLPHGSEIDTPLNYADYYYLEALKRYLDMQK